MSAHDRHLQAIPRCLTSGLVTIFCLWSAPATAYRPFDGTDAAVAAKGEMEIELQPAGRLRDESGTSLIAPATVINYFLTEGWEAVLEGIGQTPSRRLDPRISRRRGPQACGGARQPAGQDRAERRDRIRCPAPPTHCRRLLRLRRADRTRCAADFAPYCIFSLVIGKRCKLHG